MKLLTVLAFAAVLTLAVASALAAEAQQPPLTQQERFAQCAHESKGLGGEERRSFMSQCLKTRGEARAHAAREPGAGVSAEAQHEKMRSCNAEAARKELRGEARRTFMSACLKG